jgi:hypothetical protein
LLIRYFSTQPSDVDTKQGKDSALPTRRARAGAPFRSTNRRRASRRALGARAMARLAVLVELCRFSSARRLAFPNRQPVTRGCSSQALAHCPALSPAAPPALSAPARPGSTTQTHPAPSRGSPSLDQAPQRCASVPRESSASASTRFCFAVTPSVSSSDLRWLLPSTPCQRWPTDLAEVLGRLPTRPAGWPYRLSPSTCSASATSTARPLHASTPTEYGSATLLPCRQHGA